MREKKLQGVLSENPPRLLILRIFCHNFPMRNLTILLALTFTVMFSSTSFAYWTKVSKNVNGTTFYVDFERIRKHGGYVYWWDLKDNLKPTDYGDLSAKVYHQGDCKLFRFKVLSFSFHKEPMGRGTGDVQETSDKDTHPETSILFSALPRLADDAFSLVAPQDDFLDQREKMRCGGAKHLIECNDRRKYRSR